jgi:hypothetical protein
MLREGLAKSGSVTSVRIAGVRLGAPVARLLSRFSNVRATLRPRKDRERDERQITVEAPLAPTDYEAISTVLGHNCPAPLYRLRTELLEQQRRIIGG